MYSNPSVGIELADGRVFDKTRVVTGMLDDYEKMLEKNQGVGTVLRSKEVNVEKMSLDV